MMPGDHPSNFLPAAELAAIRSRAADAEVVGELHPEQLSLIRRNGWFRCLVPAEYGGLAASLPEILKLEEALAWADGSTGWVVTLCAGAGWFAGFLPAGTAEAFRRHDLCVAGSGAATGTARRDGDHYIVNGFWKYASGARHATHFTANCRVTEGGAALTGADGSPLIRAFLFDRNDVILHDTWKMNGMIATGSQAFSVHEARVPANRCFTIDAAHATVSLPAYRYPFLQLAEATLAVNISGMACHFLDLAFTLINERRYPAHLAAVENAWNELNAARRALRAAVDHSWKVCIDNAAQPAAYDAVTQSGRALFSVALGCVDRIYPLCGLRVAEYASDANRVWRDLHTASQHTLFHQ